MKKEMLVFTAFAICAVLTFSIAGVHAAAISAGQAQIDWTSLSITGNITWTTLYSSSTADAEDQTGAYDDDSQFESGWVDTSAYASTTNAYGDAYTDSDDLYAEVYAIANPASMWAYSDAEGSYEGYFTAASDGQVTFSVDYELWREVSTDYEGDLAQSGTTAKLSLWHRNNNVWTYDTHWLENTVENGDSITVSDNGTAVVTTWFYAGQLGYFRGSVSSYTWVETETVPEPATICLLSFGALSLIRRKNNK